MKGGKIPIGRPLGVPVALHYSWLVVFALVWLALGTSFYPERFPNWNGLETWGAALVGTLLFFSTVLGHEFAHALVARWRGVPVRGITLNFMGGAAEIERDAERPLDEFLISAAGPLSSVGFAGVFAAVAWATNLGHSASAPLLDAPAVVALSAGYLATINLWLAAFNSIPGFPLDGGRVLRALIWRFNGDFFAATRAAAQVGRVVALLFMAFGLFQFLRQQPIDLWYIFVGWFLNNTALQSVRQINVQAILRRVPVWRIMHTDFPWAEAGVSVRDLVFGYFVDTSRPGLPVIAEGQFVGLLARSDLATLREEQWAGTAAAQVMTPVSRLQTVEPTDTAETALRVLQSAEVSQAPVLHDGRLVGLISQGDVLRFLETPR